MPDESKFVRKDDYSRTVNLGGYQPEPPNGYEVDSGAELRAAYRVITGIGFRMAAGNITTMEVGYRPLNPATGELGEIDFYRVGHEPGHILEVKVDAQEYDLSENVLLAGIAARGSSGNITTLRLVTKNIQPDGTLDDRQEWTFGNAPEHVQEVFWEVPSPAVIVSVGLRANPGNVTHLKGWFGFLRPRVAQPV